MKVFIGSSTEAIPIMEKVAELLEDIDFIVKCWKDNESFILGRTISENLTTILNEVDAAIFIYSDDDKTWYKDRVIGSPRDNVLFEHGFFAGKLGLNKSIIVRYNEPRIPSDLAGIIYAKYEEARFNTLRNKLKVWKNDIEKSSEYKKNEISQKSNQKFQINDDVNEKITSESIELINIPQGTYYRIIDDSEIRINNPLSISKKLITQSVYHLIIGNNPSCFKGDFLPVENISFREAIIFCNKLSVKEGYNEVYTITDDIIQWNEKAKGYRLPFELEWEYALGYNNREIQENLNTLAWYCNNSENRTHEVGLKKGSVYGLFDLLGNVWEWCFDNYKDNPPQTPVFEYENRLRVLRGGSFADFDTMFSKENAFRKKQIASDKNKTIGFRIVLQN